MENQLHYIVREPKISIDNPPLLVLIHGYGSNELDLFSFSDELSDSLLIISLRAPYTLGAGSYAWYAIDFDNAGGKFSDINQAKESSKLILSCLAELKDRYTFDNEKVFLLGFSQGSILSMGMGLNFPEKFKGIIALSGYLNRELIPNSIELKKNSAISFFISHGSVDQVIPIELARQSSAYFESNSIPFIYKEYPVGHGIAPQNFHDLNSWLNGRI